MSPGEPGDPAMSPETSPAGDATGSPDEDALDLVEGLLLGQRPALTRRQVAERAGVPLAMAEQLWQLLGFPHVEDDVVAFTDSDVEALRLSRDLVELGVLGQDSQAALVRTWGRSYARLAEWQTRLLADVALDGAAEPAERIGDLAGSVLPRVERLQSYIWRRHLASAASRMLAQDTAGSAVSDLTVCFVDIVGYTSQSKAMAEAELVDWLEGFEDAATALVVDAGGRIIKTIGDEVLFVADEPTAAAEVALRMTERGEDEDDPMPRVRAGLAHGPVVSRLGDVYGPVVNVASRLTSLARPGTVLVDRGVHDELTGGAAEDGEEDDAGIEAPEDPLGDDSPYAFRRMRRASVKGYSRLQSWVLRRA